MSRSKRVRKQISRTAVPGSEKVAVHPQKLLIRESVIFILSFIFFTLFARMGIDPHHDGVMLIPAIRIAGGGVLFRDVFYQYGLLVPLLQGLAVSLFGAELLVIRLLTVGFYAGSAVLLDLLWRRFLPEKLSYMVPVLFCCISSCTMVTFHSWNSVYALFFMLLCAYFMLRYLESETPRLVWLIPAGVSAGLTWASRTPCGMVTVFAAILILLGLNWFTGKSRKLIAAEAGLFAAGCAIVALLALLYIIGFGAWDDFLKQNFSYVSNFVYNRGGGGSWQHFCDSMLPFYQEDFWYFHTFFALMPLGAMVLLYLALRRGILDGASEMKKVLPFAALLIIGLGSWHQYYPVPCVRHLFWGGAPLLGAYLLMLYRLFRQPKPAGKLCGVLLLLALAGVLYPRFYGMSRRLELNERVVSQVPGIRGIRLNDHESGIVELVTLMERLPEPLRQKGLLNWTESSLFSLMTPAAAFRDRQFYRGDFYPYESCDEKIAGYIRQHRCPVLVDHEVTLPGYIVAAEAEYLGEKFCLLIPGEYFPQLQTKGVE